MSETNQPIAFRSLVDEYKHIEVPLIQRDYAQGRKSEKDVRDDFLNALRDALVPSAAAHVVPLNLDFVYGSITGGDTPNFLPLDGQQRLTTLFLLHWYLAWVDEKLPEFKALVWDGKHSRFTYGIRPSSTEFFDELVNYFPVCAPSEVPTVRSLLENQPWFFLHWRLDPTIQSALTMLDAIHGRFKDSSGLYVRLVNGQQPAITFHLLPLEHFGLSDDLYIKMNARGKPLTAFETFKARFEERLIELFPTEMRQIEGSEIPVPQFFERRMDTQWTDFFWNCKKRGSHTFDDEVMNLLWALVRVSLDPSSSTFTDDTTLLRDRSLRANYTVFHDNGWLSRGFAEKLIVLLEAWSTGASKLVPQLPNTRYFDESTFFQKAIVTPASLEYTELVQFAAFLFYLERHDGSMEPKAFQEWMRVVFNLSENSDIERPEEYGRSLLGLHKLLPHSNQILHYLANMKIEQLGFSPVQLREEVLKAQLMLSHKDWRGRIDAAEEHGYFRGQIEFLLEFCGVSAQARRTPVQEWNERLHKQLQASFDAYLQKAQITFKKTGLASLKSQLWKRALLAIGDYLVPYRSNYSFVTDPARNPDSWKRFLRNTGTEQSQQRRQYLKLLWDRLDASAAIEPQLEKIICNSSGLEPWRSAFVKYPEAISYCHEQEIRSDDYSDEIYLLKRRQMNGAHAELFSYVLHLQLATDEARKKLRPLELQPYQSVNMTEIEPYFLLSFLHFNRRINFAIQSAKEQFRISADRANLVHVPKVEALLRQESGFNEQDGQLVLTSPREGIHQLLKQLAKSLATLPHQTS